MCYNKNNLKTGCETIGGRVNRRTYQFGRIEDGQDLRVGGLPDMNQKFEDLGCQGVFILKEIYVCYTQNINSKKRRI